MTVVAGNSGHLVPGVKESILIPAGLMATETALGVFARAGPKGKDELIRRKSPGLIASCGFLSFDVRFPGTMAGLAHQDRPGFGLKSSVGSLVELGELRTMTGAATVIANDIGRRSRFRLIPCHGGSRRRT
jgi:hypothetical protein